jgi:hypothetical protein
MEGMVCDMEEVIDGRREGIVFCVEFVCILGFLIKCYGTCLRGFILFFILILIKKNRRDL